MQSRETDKKALYADESGFTLVELIVVVIIIGLLAALVVPKLMGKVDQSKVKAAQAQIELFGAALDQFRLDTGRYPTTSEGLESLRNASGIENWSGPYLKKEIPNDPWNHQFIYKSPGERDDYEIISYGSDGSAGGDGDKQDIVSWKGLNEK
ncbi:MAG: type II secretion system major pseudopilin GspG [Deltaproteobacteria bacterium]|nr:type II secretion system major pseudopilin GspG [Deltaproteobacteria bacterium]